MTSNDHPAHAAPMLSGGSLTGHLKEMKTDPLGMLTRFNAECGAAGRLRFVTESVLLVNAPDLIHEFLVKKAHSFCKSRVLRLALSPLMGDGLFTSEGDLWKRQRKLMAPLFHAAHIGRYASSMTSAALHCAGTWSDGDVIDVSHEMTRITMSVAGRTLFGIETFDETDELGAALTVALRWISEEAQSVTAFLQAEAGAALDKLRPGHEHGVGKPIMWPGERTRKLKEALGVLEDRVHRMIAERRDGGEDRQDLLARLLAAHEGDDDYRMSDRQLRDEVLTLFVAGHETTATGLAWAFYLLAHDPDVYARLEAEVAALDGRAPTTEDLPRLQLATRIFKESLRLYPPVPVFERQATEDLTIGGIRVANGHYVAVMPWALHHRPELWPRPDHFDPERFLPEAEASRDRYAFVPFGAGPRVCIGNHFALYEGALVLAGVVQNARLALADDEPVQVDPGAATLRPLGGIRMRVTRR